MRNLESRALGGRFVVGARIGHGGMAVVHEGVDLERARAPVAIKLLSEGIDSDAARARFAREAEALTRLVHPNIVAVFGHGVTDDDVPFLVMERLRGETLADRIARGPVAPSAVREIAVAMLAALSHAHANGVIHRDVKPSNVFLCADGTIKVLDFGVAKTVAVDATELTRTGALIGTLAYMAPEQARGEAIDVRADVYGVGACMYHAISGAKPFTADSLEVLLAAVLTRVPPRLRDVAPSAPLGIVLAITRAMASDRSARYPTAAAFADALSQVNLARAVEGDADPETGAPLAAGTARPSGEGSRGRTFGLAALGLCLAFAAAVGARRLHARAPSDSPPQQTSVPGAPPPPLPRVDEVATTTVMPDAAPSVSASAVVVHPAPSAMHASVSASPSAWTPTAADGELEAASVAWSKRQGSGCIDHFDRAEALVPNVSAKLGVIRGECLMLVGRCDEGRTVLRASYLGNAAIGKAQPDVIKPGGAERFIRMAAGDKCPSAQLTPLERLEKADRTMVALSYDKPKLGPAITATEQALFSSSDPDAVSANATAQNHLAMAYATLGQCASARAHLDAACKTSAAWCQSAAVEACRGDGGVP